MYLSSLKLILKLMTHSDSTKNIEKHHCDIIVYLCLILYSQYLFKNNWW